MREARRPEDWQTDEFRKADSSETCKSYADTHEPSQTAQGVNLQVNGVDVTPEVILKFL